MILGGALQGLGNGLAQQATADADQVRKTAIMEMQQRYAQQNAQYESNLSMDRDQFKSGLSRDEAVLQGTINDDNDAKSVSRRTSSTLIVNGAQAEAQNARDKADREFEILKTKFQFENEKQLLSLRSYYDGLSHERKAELERAGFNKMWTDDSGIDYLVNEKGQKRSLGPTYVKPQARSGGGLLLNPPKGGAGLAPTGGQIMMNRDGSRS
jgi:hypothetical protein